MHLLKPCTFCSLQFENTCCHLALKQESADEDLSQLPPAPTLLPAASPLPGSPPPPPHHLRSSSSVGRSLPPPPPAPAAKSATPSPLTTTLPPPSSGIPPTLLKVLNQPFLSLKFSISSRPGWQAGTIKATLVTRNTEWTLFVQIRKKYRV